MNVGSSKTLKYDIGYKGVVWVKIGEKVIIISISGNAVIIETKNKKRFPCNIKDLQ